MTVYAFGGFGCNNVGDEAIGLGVSLSENAILMHVNKGRDGIQSVPYHDFFNMNKRFVKGDKLIIGGGGLLHCQGVVKDYNRMVDIAIGQGVKDIEIRAIGVEQNFEPYIDEVKKLLSRVNKITVRTSTSQRILEKIGFLAQYEKDFAFRLKNKIDTSKESEQHYYPRIGVITSGSPGPFDENHQFKELITLIKKHTLGANSFEFVFIPHSKAYVSWKNNDYLIGQYLWSSCDIYYYNRENLVKVREFTNDPLDVLSYYHSLDGLITYRFHGLIFSELTNIPVICAAPGVKAQSYVMDSKKRKDLYTIKTTLYDAFLEAIPAITNRHRNRANLIGNSHASL